MSDEIPVEVQRMAERLGTLDGWNHRVIRTEIDGEAWFGIHEVFYAEGGSPRLYSETAEAVVGEDVDSLRWTLQHMLAALDKPILTPADFPAVDDS